MSDSDSSYVPDESSESDEDYSDDEVEEEEEDSDMEVEEEDDEDEEEEMLVSIDVNHVSKKSKKATELTAYCSQENALIELFHKQVLDHLAALSKSKKMPRALVEMSEDTWSHILEVISDHIEEVHKTIKKM